MNNREILAGIFTDLFSIAPETIHDKLSQEEVDQWDSMQHINLVLSVEEEFSIMISPEESTEMLNFGLILLLIEEKLNS